MGGRAVRRGPRSDRLLLDHRAPVAARPAYQPGGAVRGWAELDAKPPPPVRLAPRRRRLTRVQRRTLRFRAWAWRLLLGAWFALMVLAVWAGLRWVGPAALGCPALMLAALLVLAWVAAVDLRQREAEMRAGD
ncbi:hypothetical protein [Micromonospora tulbaghiae]|uniref:hypothetical protein n=1 Tax=Micromonospora tulbaghiae TaxID=479978 RepID=UPI003439404A